MLCFESVQPDVFVPTKTTFFKVSNDSTNHSAEEATFLSIRTNILVVFGSTTFFSLVIYHLFLVWVAMSDSISYKFLKYGVKFS